MRERDAVYRTYMMELQACVNAAIRSAENEKDAFDSDAINWCDLSCVDVERVLPLYGEQFYRVLVEEVSPTSNVFREFIYDYLHSRGYLGVEVMLEW